MKNRSKQRNVKIQTSSGYDAIKEKLDEHNTLTVKQPIGSVKPKTEIAIGLNQVNHFLILHLCIENYGFLSSNLDITLVPSMINI